MKYSIEGFGQEKLLEHGLDHRDAIFLRWFADFQHTNRMLTLDDNGITYYWIQYSYVLEQIPIIGLKSDGSIRRYLRGLVEGGVLHKCTRADGEGKGSRAFFAIDSGVWTDLTEKQDHRTKSYGERDQRTDSYGGEQDQRTEQDGGRGDHGTDSYGGDSDQRTDQDGENADQRTKSYALIPPPEEDSSNRGEDTEQTESSVGAEPPPPPPETSSDTNMTDGIDPVVRTESFIRRGGLTSFRIRSQETSEQICRFAKDYGAEALEQVLRSYIAEKREAKQIVNHFDEDFPERLFDARKRMAPEESTGRVCEDCHRRVPAGAMIEWNGDHLCQLCAKQRQVRKLEQETERSAS